MTAIATAAQIALSTTAPLTGAARKAARKEFAKRGELLTRIAQAVAQLGDTWGRFSGRIHGPVYEAVVGGHSWRGYLLALTPTGVCIQDVAELDMTYTFRFGQLSTESLEGLAKRLA
jgi:hypothetical protein